VADAAALAALLLPMMVAAGHDKARSAGLIASAGIIAPVIPPSIGFVIFGVAANVSISKLFMAGIVPGVCWACAGHHLVVAGAQVKKWPPPPASRAEVLEALRESVWALGCPSSSGGPEAWACSRRPRPPWWPPCMPCSSPPWCTAS
jgi:TRAP-type C4-dicarboxylate transport system permease large subunit